MPDDTTAPTTGPLPSPRHEKFAQLMASGDYSAWEAYHNVYPLVKESTCRSNGPALFRTAFIKARVRQIQGDAAADTSMKIGEYRQFLTDIARTPIGELDENHPLTQKLTYTQIPGTKKGDAPIEVVRVEMPSKLAAVQELAKHNGWHAKVEVEHGATDALLEWLRQPGRPKEPPATEQAT